WYLAFLRWYLAFLSWYLAFLRWYLAFLSDKSKRRTKTVKKSVEPRWNQSFMYSLTSRQPSGRTLELLVWDQAGPREDDSCCLGEVMHSADSGAESRAAPVKPSISTVGGR
ncbi:hypothetical protein CRUP_008168, partial [Coryphaenoides rupestris]